MKESKYLALVQYVTNQTYPRWIKPQGEQSRWKTEASKFVIKNGLLKHIEKKVDFTLVVQKYQVQASTKRNNELHPIPVGGPWDRISIDIVGPLPVTERANRYIVTCIDYMTKWAEAKSLPDKSARQIAWFLYEEIICRYRCSQIIQSDNGLEFVNEVVKELLKQFQIWHQTVSPYKPQANGMIERFNRTLGEALSKLEEVY